jgi:hypothetical protein
VGLAGSPEVLFFTGPLEGCNKDAISNVNRCSPKVELIRKVETTTEPEIY